MEDVKLVVWMLVTTIGAGVIAFYFGNLLRQARADRYGVLVFWLIGLWAAVTTTVLALLAV